MVSTLVALVIPAVVVVLVLAGADSVARSGTLPCDGTSQNQ